MQECARSAAGLCQIWPPMSFATGFSCPKDQASTRLLPQYRDAEGIQELTIHDPVCKAVLGLVNLSPC